MKLGFIGCGKMATAMIDSIVAKNIVPASHIIVSDKDKKYLENFNKEKHIHVTLDNKEVMESTDVTIIAVKPQDISAVLEEIKPVTNKNHILISIAAGIKLSSLSIVDSKTVRVMPNTPFLVQEGASAYALSEKCTVEDKKIVESLLLAAGICYEVEEYLLDAVTGLSGSGPAFVAYLIDSFAKAGASAGLDEKISMQLAIQTFLGTAKLLKEKELSPQELIDMVSSPNGTTVAGREILENSDVGKVIEDTILKAKNRSVDLAKQ